jgi:F0F1-type ATP synthase assembly protein I
MLSNTIGLVDIVVTVIGTIVTLISIVQSARNTKHQSSNRPRPKD